MVLLGISHYIVSQFRLSLSLFCLAEPVAAMLNNPELAPLLAAIIAERPQEAPLFVGAGGKPLTTRRIHQIVARAAERAGLGRVWPHVLRRTFATTLDEAGISERVIQELMGHESLATTQVYLAVTEERKRQAIRDLRYW